MGTPAAVDRSAHIPSANADRHLRMEKTCAELKEAIDSGSMGDVVSKHEALILQYYQDVQDQAKQSFGTARSAARVGFWVVIVALGYALLFDALARFGKVAPPTSESMSVARVGLISGAIIELVAGVAFWLYSRGARQFGAFHICLERTHRYLLAYTIANQITGDKDDALQRLACIMANAPMIARTDMESAASGLSAITLSPPATIPSTI
ncbi:MAG: hypothetical protein JWM41_479 [Gemmatimonadetes bacterium]|nr:hypothetical protein [Gemmatimonadota bacterium]